MDFQLNKFSVHRLINARSQNPNLSLSKWIVDTYRKSKIDNESLESFAHRIAMCFTNKTTQI